MRKKKSLLKRTCLICYNISTKWYSEIAMTQVLVRFCQNWNSSYSSYFHSQQFLGMHRSYCTYLYKCTLVLHIQVWYTNINILVKDLFKYSSCTMLNWLVSYWNPFLTFTEQKKYILSIYHNSSNGIWNL